MQRWFMFSDTHTGATTGLTYTPQNEIQNKLLDRFTDCISHFQLDKNPPDVTLHVGDAYDGCDPKGGDVTDPRITHQIKESAKLIALTNPQSEAIIITGTPYHTMILNQNFEDFLGEAIQNKCHEWYGTWPKVTIKTKLKTFINGWFMLEARHFINSTVTPYRATASLRNQMWNIMNAALESFEKERPSKWPDLLVYGHTHYYSYVENAWGGVMILPSWQALGGKYGDEKCSGHVDLGGVLLTVGEKGDVDFCKRLYQAGVVSRTEYR